MLGVKFNLGDTVSFDMYPTPITGGSHKFAKVLSVLDAQTLSALGEDPVAMHDQVYPYLPSGTPDSAWQYSYLKLQLANQTIVYVGLTWIKEDSVQVTAMTDILVRIRRVQPSDVAKVALALSSNGFTLDGDSVSVVPGTQAP
jgi:hypothetical protein